MRILLAALAALVPVVAFGQTLDNSVLNGRYGFVHYWIDVNDSGVARNARNLGGVADFNGHGGFTFQGQLGSGPGAGTATPGGRSYSVSSNGFVTLESPIEPGAILNARIGDQADVILGSSTEGFSGGYDLFIAVRLPDNGPGNGLLSGAYTGASLWLPDGSDLAIKTALVSLSPNGTGGFTALTAEGHAANEGERPLQQTVTAATYSVAPNGTGTLSLGTSATLFQGSKTIYVSSSGNYIIGHSTGAGERDVFVAIRNLSGGATNASLSGDYWIVDLFADKSENYYNAAIGALKSGGAGVASIAQRLKIGDTLDFSAINPYGLTANGTGFLRGVPEPNLKNFAVGAPGARPALGDEQGPSQAVSANGFVAAEVYQAGEYTRHGLSVGVKLPTFSGGGVFLAPNGVLNAASGAPITHPISPGAILSLYGSGLAAQLGQPTNVPLPTQVNGVSVTVNGTPAPLFFVSPNQINIQAPFALQGATADIVVTNNGQTSNTVRVPVAATSPGVFSAQGTGYGPGIVTHPNFSLVTAQNPTRRGEVVIIFLTGLGAVNPPFPDGAAGPINPLSRTVDQNVQVLFGGEPGEVAYSGAAPNFVGLYQLNVRLPATGYTGTVPVAIQTSNAFSDFIDIEVAP